MILALITQSGVETETLLHLDGTVKSMLLILFAKPRLNRIPKTLLALWLMLAEGISIKLTKFLRVDIKLT